MKKEAVLDSELVLQHQLQINIHHNNFVIVIPRDDMSIREITG